jgi:hypothetical protein
MPKIIIIFIDIMAELAMMLKQIKVEAENQCCFPIPPVMPSGCSHL